ncbi:hypothetical protein Golob_012890 [Gossypium lobatum]|uniref:Uncharacterized protein n=2 Tax=Gossypium TaxID=3633 RepID=A0A7J8WXB4_GOSAI|nr:hypothetical protein [Gossypium lobatum]MBA0679676.1 hypothetical protein [Gossypium aridum]
MCSWQPTQKRMFVISEWKEAGWKDPVSFIPESLTLFWLRCTRSTVLKAYCLGRTSLW